MKKHIRNANPRPLPSSPRRRSMIEEPEHECKPTIQTHKTVSTEGESVPFTRRELQELPFTQHIVEAEVHQEPKDEIQIVKNLNDTNPSPSSTSPEEKSINPAPRTDPNIIDTTSIIPPNLLQIIDDLTKDLDDRNENNKNHDSFTNNTDDEDEQDSISHNREVIKNSEICNNNNDDINDNEDNISNSDTDNDDNNNDDDNDDDEVDIDKNFNKFDPDKTKDLNDPQIVTRSQIHSIINSRDQIFMHKENYLYFMSADGNPYDNGSKSLQEQKLIPQMPKGQIGRVTLIKRGNKTHFILICKNKINVTKETL